jgi:hypothetical protein
MLVCTPEQWVYSENFEMSDGRSFNRTTLIEDGDETVTWRDNANGELVDAPPFDPNGSYPLSPNFYG